MEDEAAKKPTADKYVWEDGMDEISGFGEGYEATCRAMLRAGLAWLDAHPEANPVFGSYDPSAGRRTEDNADAKALDAAITAVDDGCSGAMFAAVASACLFIRINGWDEYVNQMKERKKLQRERA